MTGPNSPITVWIGLRKLSSQSIRSQTNGKEWIAKGMLALNCEHSLNHKTANIKNRGQARKRLLKLANEKLFKIKVSKRALPLLLNLRAFCGRSVRFALAMSAQARRRIPDRQLRRSSACLALGWNIRPHQNSAYGIDLQNAAWCSSLIVWFGFEDAAIVLAVCSPECSQAGSRVSIEFEL